MTYWQFHREIARRQAEFLLESNLPPAANVAPDMRRIELDVLAEAKLRSLGARVQEARWMEQWRDPEYRESLKRLLDGEIEAIEPKPTATGLMIMTDWLRRP